jgi:predicted ATPase
MAVLHPSRPPRATEWCVITGAPCSGKTTIVNELARRGFRVVPEAARAYIEAEIKRGRRLEEIKSDPARFEGHIFRTKLAVETRLPARKRIFLDRALPDSIAYYRLEGLDPAEPQRQSLRVRYRRVFLFERMAFRKDSVRSEDPETAEQIERLIEGAYTDLGYAIVRVPFMAVAERADFLLARA